MRRTAAFAAALAAAATGAAEPRFEIVGEPRPFAPGIATTNYSDVRLTLAPDGRTALWFSRNRPGGPGGYDIWVSRRAAAHATWSPAEPAPFNSDSRDFDPAFSADGRYVYFSSDRAGGQGGDDLWRVPANQGQFGEAQNLGAAVNSPRNEWAAAPSPDGRALLFSSDRDGGAGRMDLYTARAHGAGFGAVHAVPGALNTTEDEFDATYLRDGATLVFTRAPDLTKDAVRLFISGRARAGYERGAPLPGGVNTPASDTYAPMLDWSTRDRLTFTTRRPPDNTAGADVYVVRYRLR